MNNWIDRLERRYSRFAIPYLVNGLMVGQLAAGLIVLLINWQFSGFISLSRSAVLHGQIWRLITFLFQPVWLGGALGILNLVFYFWIGNSLTRAWGDFRMTLFIALGVLGAWISCFLAGGASPDGIFLSMMFAYTWMWPEQGVLLFGIIPFKMKYLGWYELFVWVVQFLMGSLTTKISLVLSLLGFRALRRENGYFTACFVLILLRCACFFPTLILNTFACRDDFIPERVTTSLTQVSVAVQLLGLFCLWLGLRAVQRKAGLPPRAGGVLALMLWYGVVYLLVLIQYPGMILPLILLVAFIFILRSICKTTKALSEAGYTMHPAPVKVPDLWLELILAAALVLGCAAGYLFGAQHSMDWQPLEETRSAETAEIKAHLLELGFPEVILNDLAEEDLAACAGALRVDVESKVYSPTLRHENTSNKRLRITGIAVQVPGENETWVILHHFLWETGPEFFGTDALQVWPLYQLGPEGWVKGGDVTGRLLYDRDGQTYTAPYYFLGEAIGTDTGPRCGHGLSVPGHSADGHLRRVLPTPGGGKPAGVSGLHRVQYEGCLCYHQLL